MSVDLCLTVNSIKTDKKNESLSCFGCRDTLEDSHLGIRCAQNHHLCVICSANLVTLFLAEPNTNLPPRCMICRFQLNPSIFERQLLPCQFDKYTSIMLSLLWSKDVLNGNEEIIHCAFCSYAEIRVQSSGAQFMFCKHKDCRKTTCLVCLLEVPLLEDNYDEAEDEEYEENMKAIEKHFKCSELREPKAVLEKAIANGQNVACPGCGLAGMKDDACTHMTCPECQTTWCYFCGLKESECDKSEENEFVFDIATPIYRHNRDWETNPKRCPMYLSAISDIDESWPVDEDACLEYFHRIRSLKYLRQAYEELGAETIQQLNDQFHIIDTCGFDLDDIRHGNIQLINYDNPNSTSNDEDSD